MPDVALGAERARAVTSLGDVSSDTLGKDVVLEEADSLGSETGADEEEEARRADEEPVESRGRAGPVDGVPDNGSADEADDDGDGDGLGGEVERHLG